MICAINGYALGGGLEVALACDIRIIAAGAKVGQPETALGIFPGFGGAQRLPRLINAGNAKYYIYTAEHISAERAYAMGLVQEVVALEELLPRCQALAEKIMANGPVAVRLAKQAINEGMNMGLRPALQYDAEIFGALFGTEDRINGMDAFLAKGKPEFRNR
ncbi:Short-chain-enoyl-CoA hydratase [bioreactor metagenome]|uniref:Short-chain-enoyl-CoA hydratase n=1 Tax=bioreactor metagenome TaxID=1076179 RepID=A0A645I2H8_9ZZZZ